MGCGNKCPRPELVQYTDCVGCAGPVMVSSGEINDPLLVELCGVVARARIVRGLQVVEYGKPADVIPFPVPLDNSSQMAGVTVESESVN